MQKIVVDGSTSESTYDTYVLRLTGLLSQQPWLTAGLLAQQALRRLSDKISTET